MPYYVHVLDGDGHETPHYVRATPRTFDQPEDANAYAAALDPELRPLVTTSPEPPPMEDDSVSDSTS